MTTKSFKNVSYLTVEELGLFFTKLPIELMHQILKVKDFKSTNQFQHQRYLSEVNEPKEKALPRVRRSVFFEAKEIFTLICIIN